MLQKRFFVFICLIITVPFTTVCMEGKKTETISAPDHIATLKKVVTEQKKSEPSMFNRYNGYWVPFLSTNYYSHRITFRQLRILDYTMKQCP